MITSHHKTTLIIIKGTNGAIIYPETSTEMGTIITTSETTTGVTTHRMVIITIIALETVIITTTKDTDHR